MQVAAWPVLSSLMQANAGWRWATMALAIACLCGCNGAPAQSILGSYFPSWMLCAVFGLILAVISRIALAAAGIDHSVPAPLFVYLALAVAYAFGLWLIWLG